jgi:hypothetical protein
VDLPVVQETVIEHRTSEQHSVSVSGLAFVVEHVEDVLGRFFKPAFAGSTGFVWSAVHLLAPD